jgi:hypothetical protein
MPTMNEERLELYRAAEVKILKGQSVRFGDRELRYADLKEIRAEIEKLQRAVSSERRGGRPGFATADFGGVT